MRKTAAVLGFLALALLYSAGAFGQTQSWPRPSETRPVTQGGDWTIAHIGSTVHVAGSVAVSGGSITATTGPIPHITSVTHVVGVTRLHYSGALRATQVQSCGTTAATVVPTNEGRRDLYVKNIGNSTQGAHTVWLGYGATGHVALTKDNGWALHAAGSFFVQNPAQTVNVGLVYSNTEIRLENYQGPLSCISTGSGSNLSVIEVLR